MRSWLSARALLYLAAVVLAALGIGNAFVAVFAPARYEVVYQFDATVSYCTEERCTYDALLSVANTGREPQEQLEITIDGIPTGLASRPRFLNLDASFPREGDPQVKRSRREGTLLLSIRNLQPGTLLQLPFRGTLPRERVQRAAEPGISVEGRGRMIEGNPRGVAFARWFAQAKLPRLPCHPDSPDCRSLQAV